MTLRDVHRSAAPRPLYGPCTIVCNLQACVALRWPEIHSPVCRWVIREPAGAFVPPPCEVGERLAASFARAAQTQLFRDSDFTTMVFRGALRGRSPASEVLRACLPEQHGAPACGTQRGPSTFATPDQVRQSDHLPCAGRYNRPWPLSSPVNDAPTVARFGHIGSRCPFARPRDKRACRQPGRSFVHGVLPWLRGKAARRSCACRPPVAFYPAR